MPIDKQKHFVAGFAIAVLVYPLLGLLAAFVAAAAIEVAKEMYDRRHVPEQTPDFWDAMSTAAGALPVATFHLARAY
jgi:hypothetical protein